MCVCVCVCVRKRRESNPDSLFLETQSAALQRWKQACVLICVEVGVKTHLLGLKTRLLLPYFNIYTEGKAFILAWATYVGLIKAKICPGSFQRVN